MKLNILFLHAIFIAIFFASCSDDPASSNDGSFNNTYNEGAFFINDPTNSNTIENPNNIIDPNNPNVNYSSNNVNPYSLQNPNNVNLSNTIISSSSNVLSNDINNSSIALQSSSSIAILTSSSLKEYEDNHAPKASVLPPAGFYSNLTIQPLTPQKGGNVRCTFDGSIPNQGSEQISQARQISKNTVIRCSEFVNGQAVDTTTQTYFINENVNMAVVAITVNHYDMFDSSNGLYATGDLNNNMGGENMGGFNMGGFPGFNDGNVTDDNNPKCTEPCQQANFWSDKELPVHVEYFENGSSTKTKNWEIDAGISIIGNWSRYKPKKSVAIKMDNDIYGDKVLKYSLFKTRNEAKKFKSFNLRNNGNRFWTDYIGDAMMTALMEGTEVDYQRSHQVVVFYNGEYFGIHDMRERLNRHFVETNYGIDSKSINVIKQQGSSLEASGTNGASTAEYQQVLNFINSNDFQGDNNNQYEELKKKLNVGSFAEYMIAEIYMHNGDWPGNNVRVWGGNGHPFKFIIFDVDHGFGFTPGISGFDPQSTNMFQWIKNNSNGGFAGFGGFGDMGGMGGGMNAATIAGMFQKLLENNEFKNMFINRSAVLLNNNLTASNVERIVKEMMGSIPNSEQQRDQQKWPRNQSRFTFDPTGNTLIQFARNRSETVKQELCQEFGLQNNEITVTIASNGNGFVTMDGMKLPSTNYQGKFFSGTQMKLTANPTNGSVFSGWSDGNFENPRIVQPNNGSNFTAQFK